MNIDLPQQGVTFSKLDQVFVLLGGVAFILPVVRSDDKTNRSVVLGNISGGIDDTEISLTLCRVADVMALILSSEAPRCRSRLRGQNTRVGHLRIGGRNCSLLLVVDDARVSEDPPHKVDVQRVHQKLRGECLTLGCQAVRSSTMCSAEFLEDCIDAFAGRGPFDNNSAIGSDVLKNVVRVSRGSEALNCGSHYELRRSDETA